MADLDKAIAALRALNEAVPKPPKLPDAARVAEIERRSGLTFPPDLVRYFLSASDVTLATYEPATLTDPNSHTFFLTILGNFRAMGGSADLVPFCEDNGDFFCIDSHGRVVFWDHNGQSDESWDSLAEWIEQVWIGEA